MSPKKSIRRPKRAAQRGQPCSAPEPAAPAGEPPVRTRREPVVIRDRPRWPIAVWVLLVLTWLGGSFVFFVLYLAEALWMLQASEVTGQDRRSAAGYLVFLLVCALGVPLAGAVTALCLRRRLAAAMFALALACSALAVFSLASPAEILAGITGAYG